MAAFSAVKPRMLTSQKLTTAELLYQRAQQMSLQPVWLQPGALFAVTTADGERYVNYAKGEVNSQLSSSLVGNKLKTRLILDRHDVPSIAYLNPRDHVEAQEFL